jgi:hypothetical protein
MEWSVIRQPLEVHGARTPDEYRRKHEAFAAFLRGRGRPVVLWEADQGAPVIVSGGIALVSCACGDAAAASRAWDEARCFGCGAIYRQLDWPEAWDAIVDALLARPTANRHWGTYLGPATVRRDETVAELQADNRRHGHSESAAAMHVREGR